MSSGLSRFISPFDDRARSPRLVQPECLAGADIVQPYAQPAIGKPFTGALQQTPDGHASIADAPDRLAQDGIDRDVRIIRQHADFRGDVR